MLHGGKRPGAGRKRGARTKLDQALAAAAVEAALDVPTIQIKPTLAATAQQYVPQAMQTMLGLMLDPACSESVRAGIAERILQHAAKADDRTAETAPEREVSDLELARWILAVMDSAAARREEAANAAEGAA